jgi:hypothetical protein
MGLRNDPLAGMAGGDRPDLDLLTTGVEAVNGRFSAG